MPSQTILFQLEATVVHVKVDESPVIDFLLARLRESNPKGDFQREFSLEQTLRQAEAKVRGPALEEIKKAVSLKLAEAEVASAASATERKDARRTISALQSTGVGAAVITGLSERGAREVLKHLDLEGALTIAASRDDSADGKERLTIALKKLGSKPEDVILVGAGPRAVEAARAAGVRCFVVYSQEVPVNRVIESKPDALLFSIFELGDTLLLLAQKSQPREVKPKTEAAAAQEPAEEPDPARTTEPGPETAGGP